MKKLTLTIVFISVLTLTIFSTASAQISVFRPSQGGTGIGSAVAGDIGKCLKVLTNSPFTYEVNTCGATSFAWPFTKQADLSQGTSTLLSLFGGLFTNASSTLASTTISKLLITGSASSSNFFTGNLLTWGSSTIQSLFSPSATATNLYSTNFLANGSSTLQNATSSAFAISSIISSLLKTSATGSVIPAILGTDYINSSEQNYKEAVKYASTAALPTVVYANGSSGVGATLTGASVGALSLDSSSPSVNDRILIKNQVDQTQNGIYKVAATGSGIAVFIMTRATDFDEPVEIMTGDATFITAGATQINTTWAYTGIDSPTIGSTNLTFTQIAGSGVGGSFAYPFLTLSGTAIQATSSVMNFNGGLLTSASSTLASTTLTSLLSANATSTDLYVGNIASTTKLRANIANLGALYAGGIGLAGSDPLANTLVIGSSGGIISPNVNSNSIGNNVPLALTGGGTEAGGITFSVNGEKARLTVGGYLGISTTTPHYLIQGASSTAPQLALTYGAGVNHWTFRNTGGIFDLATSSDTSFATSSASAFRLTTNGQPIFPFLSAANCDVKADTSGNLTCGTDSTTGTFAYPFFTSGATMSATSTTLGLFGGFFSNASSTVNNALLITGSTTLQNFTGSNATTSNLYLGAKHIDFNSVAAYVSGTTTASFRIASSTIGSEKAGFNVGTTTIQLAIWPELRKVLSITCKTATSTPGGVMIELKRSSGNISNFAFCDGNTRQTVFSSNNTFSSLEDFTVRIGKASSTPDSVFMTFSINKLSD